MQTQQLKENMVTIRAYQLLSNSDLYKHRFLENIKKLLKHAVKYDDHQKYKAIIEAAMVSNPKEITDNSPLDAGKLVILKNPTERKSLI